MIRLHHALVGATIFIMLTWVTSTADAEDKLRTWSDKTGKFRVVAKRVSHDEKQVKLLKSDGLTVTVPRSALSDADNEHLAEIATEPDASNPFAGGETMPSVESGSSNVASSSRSTNKPMARSGETIELPSSGQDLFINIDEALPALQSDPRPSPIAFAPFARPIAILDAYARASAPVIVDPEKMIVAISTHRNGNAVSPDNFGRIYLVSRETKQPKPVWDDAQTLMLMDHHVSSDRSIAVQGVDSPSDRGGDLLLMTDLAKGSPTVLAKWHLPEYQKPGFAPKVEFARLLDASTAVVRVNNTVYLWDLESGELKFKVPVDSGSQVCVSGGGAYLAIPVGSGCKIVDLKKGEYLGKIAFPGLLTPQVQFSPDGKRLGMVAGNQFVVWNFETASVDAEDIIGTTLGALYGWVDNQHLLTQFALIDTELKIGVWAYSLPSKEVVQTVPGGVIVSDKSSGSTPALVALLDVPHKPVMEAKNRLKNVNPSMLAVAPGTTVQLQIDAPGEVDRGEMESALRTAVEKAGWKVGGSGDVQVIAKIERGETQKLNFRNIGSPSFGPGKEYNLKPYRASLDITQNGKSVWKSSYQNMVPMLLFLQNGETLEQALKKYEKPDPAYFGRVVIPPRIFKPEFQAQAGTSRMAEGAWK